MTERHMPITRFRIARPAKRGRPMNQHRPVRLSEGRAVSLTHSSHANSITASRGSCATPPSSTTYGRLPPRPFRNDEPSSTWDASISRSASCPSSRTRKRKPWRAGEHSRTSASIPTGNPPRGKEAAQAGNDFAAPASETIVDRSRNAKPGTANADRTDPFLQPFSRVRNPRPYPLPIIDGPDAEGGTRCIRHAPSAFSRAKEGGKSAAKLRTECLRSPVRRAAHAAHAARRSAREDRL